MEENEMEMTKDELQKWIRGKVMKNKLIVEVVEKCSLLQSLLERREDQAVHLLQLCKSVAACEAVVRKQYALLGWEYRDTDSDDDYNVTVCEKSPPFRHGTFARAENQDPSFPRTNGTTPLLPNLRDSVNVCKDKDTEPLISLKRRPVVVLTRLSSRMVSSLRSATPQSHDSKEEFSGNFDSDTHWQPNRDLSDSDYSMSNYNSGSNKRRRIDQTFEECDKSALKQQANPNTGAKCHTAKSTGTKRKTAKPLTPQADTTVKVLTPSPNSKGVSVTTFGQSSKKAMTTRIPPIIPGGKICVNMNVLARRRARGWQLGKIQEIVTKEDGRVKYKIVFEDKGRSLVSGHHIAFDHSPRPEQLYVGARVVVETEDKKPCFCPGVVAELPNRKNRMRFLVFMDDQTPVYLGLPSLHVTCKPLTSPLDDIANDTHRDFLRQYIDDWPCPLQVRYKAGQIINAKLKGIQQKCEVQIVDGSLIRVLFQSDQKKEWIYCGSPRLERVIKMRQNLSLKNEGQKNKFTTVNESSKSAH